MQAEARGLWWPRDTHVKTVLTVALLTIALAGCSSAEERTLLGQFFAASRLRDLTAVHNIATVAFEPATDGIVTSFEIVRITVVQASRPGDGEGRVDFRAREVVRRSCRIEIVHRHDAARLARERSKPFGRMDDHCLQGRPGISFDSATVTTHAPFRFSRLTLASLESTVG